MHTQPLLPTRRRNKVAQPDGHRRAFGTTQGSSERPSTSVAWARYRQMVEFSAEALLVYSAGKVLLINPAAARLLGLNPSEQLNGRALRDFIDPRFHTLFEEQAGANGTSGFQEQIWQRVDGTPFDAEVGISDLRFDNRAARQIVIRDISARKRAEALQLGQNQILNMIATGAPLSEVLREIASFIERHARGGLCSILMLDESGTSLIERVAPTLPAAYLERIGIARVGPCNCSCGTAVFRREPVMVTDIATDPLWESRRALALEFGLRACTSWPIFGRDKNVLGSFALYFREAVAPAAADLALFSMCTKLAGIAIERHMAEERIRTLAHYDGLTGLPNRFLFQEYLEQALRNAQRRRKQFAVLFLDLDHFKEINDTLGHDAGDHALRKVAARLRACLRESDKVARMGGDEFYVLIEDLADGRYAADVGHKLLEAAARPVQIGDRSCLLGASIGIALYPRDGTDGRTLLMNADSAMYEAKEAGRNACRFHAQGTIQWDREIAQHK